MDQIKFIIGILLAVVFYIVLTKIFMNIANYIGEKLGFGKFFMGLLLKHKDTIDKEPDHN